MPSIDIQVLEGDFSEAEKAAIITKVTSAFGEVTGATIRDNTSVRIHEVCSGSWGYGDNVLTTEDALAMRTLG
jgi:4-oxalocrotonate tautomerase